MTKRSEWCIEIRFALAMLTFGLSVYLLFMTLITPEPLIPMDINIAMYFKSTWATLFIMTAIIGLYMLLSVIEDFRSEG